MEQRVSMVLNPHGIPTFSKLDGGGFYSYYNVQVSKLDIERKNVQKKHEYKKHLTQFLKMGSIPCWIQFHAYRIKGIILIK